MQVLLVIEAECAALAKDTIARHIRIFTLQIGTETQQLQLHTKSKYEKLKLKQSSTPDACLNSTNPHTYRQRVNPANWYSSV